MHWHIQEKRKCSIHLRANSQSTKGNIKVRSCLTLPLPLSLFLYCVLKCFIWLTQEIPFRQLNQLNKARKLAADTAHRERTMTNKAKSARKTKLNQSKTAASNEERTHAIDKGLRVTSSMSGREREREE